jgi:hypothetical protein
MWYDKSRLLSYNKLFNFILGPRGDGKSYDMKKWCIKDFKKTGAQFIVIRRFKEELDDTAKAYFDDIRQEFPEDKLEVKGKQVYINDMIAGYFIPLSTSMKKKSVPYPLVNKIIYEEFIIDKGTLRYLPREVDTFLEFYETVARLRDNVRAVFVANAITIVNPYFLYWNIKPNTSKKFTVTDHVAIELIKDNEYTQAKLNTRFGQMLQGTAYGKYALEGKFLRDNDVFIAKKTAKSEFMLGMKYNGTMYGFWVDYAAGFIYVNTQFDPSSYQLYAITKDDHEPNLLLIKSLSTCKPMQRIVYAFQHGLIRFTDMQIKNQFYEFIGYFTR